MGKSDLAIQSCPILLLGASITPHIAALSNGRFFMLQEVMQPVELRARCDAALRQKIRAAAEEAVRSMSAEITYRLQKSFERAETEQMTS
jgi:Arc-like DNA binding dprotein